MISTPTTRAGVEAAARLEAEIRCRLQCPRLTALFDAYINLTDSLAGGISGEPLAVEYDALIREDLAHAREILCLIPPPT